MFKKPSASIEIVFLKPEKLKELWALEPKILSKSNLQESRFLLKTKRPYIGPVININGWDFYAPLSTNIQNKKFDSNHLSIFMYSNNHLIKFNQMIPIKTQSIDKKASLKESQLYKQENNSLVFYNKAKKTYLNKKYDSIPALSKAALNFEMTIKIYEQHLAQKNTQQLQNNCKENNQANDLARKMKDIAKKEISVKNITSIKNINKIKI